MPTFKLELHQGDITKMNVHAIVNAANTSLLGGGGVDGAIHRAAGPDLLHECRLLNGCKTGEAKITKGYNLPARYIIHTPGPHWNGGNSHEEEKLYNSYFNSLKLANEYNLTSIAFPNISTGIYGFPKPLAAHTALRAIEDFKPINKSITTITFVCFDEENYNLYKNLLTL